LFICPKSATYRLKTEWSEGESRASAQYDGHCIIVLTEIPHSTYCSYPCGRQTADGYTTTQPDGRSDMNITIEVTQTL
jgi:hypothetical protein